MAHANLQYISVSDCVQGAVRLLSNARNQFLLAGFIFAGKTA